MTGSLMAGVIITDRIRELIMSLPERETFYPDCVCIPNERKAGISFERYQYGLGMKGRFLTFDRDLRYMVFFYSDHDEIREINEFLISYQRAKTWVLQKRPEHPFGRVDHFVLAYRHCAFFTDWLGIKRRKARHRWRIPEWLMLGVRQHGFPVIQESPNYSSFVRNMQVRVDTGEKQLFNPEFVADVKELGSTRVVIENDNDIFLESDHLGSNSDWLSKWTMLKLRWT